MLVSPGAGWAPGVCSLCSHTRPLRKGTMLRFMPGCHHLEILNNLIFEFMKSEGTWNMQRSRGAMLGINVHICRLKPDAMAAGLANQRACAHLGLSRALRSSPTQVLGPDWLMEQGIADCCCCLSLCLSPFLLGLSLSFPLSCYPPSSLPSSSLSCNGLSYMLNMC